MDCRWVGAMLIIAACGGFGIFTGFVYRREEAMLRQMLDALTYMECQLQFHLTPLPELCGEVAQQISGPVGTLFFNLAKELALQITPEAAGCMHRALDESDGLCLSIREAALQLGRSMGRFDLSGQLKGLASVQHDCERKLELLSRNRDMRLRSYQTLGFCAGTALAILFI